MSSWKSEFKENDVIRSEFLEFINFLQSFRKPFLTVALEWNLLTWNILPEVWTFLRKFNVVGLVESFSKEC